MADLPSRVRTYTRALGYLSVTQTGGLTAEDPLGRSSAAPALPLGRVVLRTCAPPRSSHPSGGLLNSLPGTSV